MASRSLGHTRYAPQAVTVYGAGIFGLSCAFELARRGVTVQVLDDRGIGAGSSGGTVGALAPHVPEQWEPKKQFQLESLLMARAFWADVAQIGGADSGYARIGRIQPLADQAQIARARDRAQGAATYWGDNAEWRVIPATDFTVLDCVSPTGWMIHDTLSGRINPRAACQALALALRALGATISIGRDMSPAYTTVIHATGTRGLAQLSADFNTAVGNGVKGQSAVFKFDAPFAPQLYTDGLHFVPHSNGTLAIGSTSERYYDDPTTTDFQLDLVIEKARSLCPALRDAPVIDRWAGVRPRAKTRAPMLGPWPDRPGHFIVNGGFKIGLGMAPKIAHVMADLILTGTDTIPQGFHVQDNL
ncbi:oxidoreductase [Thioclava sp. SK-1]|uniref:NAD(P)/FAD-dependent oxidoreductase n=1 Tax=Thioclava sp. SK-1 TaxID=1889770 RepID=UPI0008263CEA|nr:FAD-binding oxidoreductase [Thioclava sp. SK-1]OCX66515.1 oxidoreductase [Thioclava sp. SK-1]